MPRIEKIGENLYYIYERLDENTVSVCKVSFAIGFDVTTIKQTEVEIKETDTVISI